MLNLPRIALNVHNFLKDSMNLKFGTPVCPSFWATVCKTVRRLLSDRRPVCLSVCDVGA